MPVGRHLSDRGRRGAGSGAAASVALQALSAIQAGVSCIRRERLAILVSGTREGLAAARIRGRVGGRPTVITPEILPASRDMLPNPDNSVESIAKILGVSPGTLYNHIPDLRELRTSRHTTEPDAIPGPHPPRSPASAARPTRPDAAAPKPARPPRTAR